MKNLFFLSLMLMLLSTAYSQKNFAPLGAEWKYEGFSVFCEGNHIRYTVTSEQFIEDKDCSWISSYQWSDDEMAWLTRDSLLVWEDDHQIYFYEDTSFYLLFDFNAEAGDTVMSYDPVDRLLFSNTIYSPEDTVPHLYPYYVEEVGELMIDGLPYKTFTTPDEFYFADNVTVRHTIIENIGSDGMSITGTSGFVVTMGCAGGIVCYRNDDIYYESGFLSCDSLTNLRDILLAEEFKVYPNPTTGIFQLEQPASLPVGNYQIIDTNGRVILAGTIVGSIDLTGFPQGIYYLQLRLERGENIFKKIVKQ